MKNSFILEIGIYQVSKHGNQVCGDSFQTRRIRSENRYVAVLSDGLGSGIKANVLSTLAASMAVNFTVMREPIERAANVMLETLPLDSKRSIGYSTFTILDIDNSGEVDAVEFGNPPMILVREDKCLKIKREAAILSGNFSGKKMYRSAFMLEQEDRLILMSDGVSQSGIGNESMPFGWELSGVEEYIMAILKEKKNISAQELSTKIVKKSIANDIYKPKDDISCAVVYFRRPRRLLLMSGPPFHESKDAYMGSLVKNFDGKKIICGGTTSLIVSRELGREIETDLDWDNINKGLPPTSKMEGVDLITEGVLTLSKVVDGLKSYQLSTISSQLGNDPASEIIKIMLNSDIIDIVVGTKINVAHQDPSLPVELEIRRNVMKKIAQLLENKFMKEVRIEFI